MVDAASAELVAKTLRGGEPEVRDRKAETVVEAEDVLGLEVAMINIQGVAVLNCVQQLKKDLLDESIIAQIASPVKDLSEKVAVRAVVHDDEGVLVVLDDAVKRDDVGVARRELVERDLTDVELALAGRAALVRVGKALDGVRRRCRGKRVDCAVDDTVASISKDLD